MAGYGTNADFNAWLASKGYVLPGTAPSVDVLRERGSSYVDAVYGPRFVGVPTGGVDQERAWPRSGAYVYGQLLLDTVIPSAVIQASYHAAYAEGLKPGTLAGRVVAGRAIKRQKVEGIEREFFEPTEGVLIGTTLFGEIEGLLARFLIVEVAGFGIYAI